MMPPLTIALAIVALFIVAIFLTYGTGFHRGHISGFHEGMDVARDDIKALKADFRHWHTIKDTPQFPCLIIIRKQLEDSPTPDYTLWEFENSQQWENVFAFYRVHRDVGVLWYDIRRITTTE